MCYFSFIFGYLVVFCSLMAVEIHFCLYFIWFLLHKYSQQLSCINLRHIVPRQFVEHAAVICGPFRPRASRQNHVVLELLDCPAAQNWYCWSLFIIYFMIRFINLPNIWTAMFSSISMWPSWQCPADAFHLSNDLIVHIWTMFRSCMSGCIWIFEPQPEKLLVYKEHYLT